MSFIQLKNVTFSFDKQNVFSQINLEMSQGEFLYLVGQSGSGKTTLLRLLYMDIFPTEGEVLIGGYSSSIIKKKQIPYLRRKIGIIFQDFKLIEDKTVYENIAFVLHVTGWKSKDIQKAVLSVLNDVGLSHKRSNYPHELSGGEQQRVALARAIVNDPFVLLADEPTGNLDPTVGMEILNLLENINKRGTAVIMATHNYGLVKKYPHRIAQLNEGKLFEVQLKKK
jgi:cell division transport system ATP-binding protein